MMKSDARVLVVTGAGISAESGIPTFRGKGGYWRSLDPRRLATADAFQENPELVWEWYRERRALIRRSHPNAAHQALVQLASSATGFLLLTQNVDDLHARAEWQGRRLPAEAMVQIHGNIFVTCCTGCDFRRYDGTSDEAGVPVCPHCGARLRPGVVWFDEELPRDEVRRVESYLSRGPCDLVLVIGTTASFGYIIEWAQHAAGSSGRLIEINPEESHLSDLASEVIREPAAIALPQLLRRLLPSP